MTSLSLREEVDVSQLSHAERDALKIEEQQAKYGGKFGHEEIFKALMYLLDNMNRATIPWIVVGKLSEQMYALDLPVLAADKIEAVVLRRHMSRSGVSMLMSLLKEADDIEQDEDVITFTHFGVPVQLTTVDNDTEYFSNPDTRIYMTEIFRFPNPYSKYLETIQ